MNVASPLGDNGVLPANPPRRRKPTDEFPGFLRRSLRAFGRRIADGEDWALPELVALSAEVDAAVQRAVEGLRFKGYSWGEVGALLGMTRQGARQRWRREGDADSVEDS